MLKTTILGLLIMLLSACATISDSKPRVRGISYYIDNFPKLEQKIVYLTQEEISEKCERHKPAGKHFQESVACSAINLDAKTCIIFIPNDYEFWMLQHEQAHCVGGDHDYVLSDYFKKWKNLNKNIN